jgi:hypothetical protein
MRFDFVRKSAGRRRMPVGFKRKLKKFSINWLVKLTNPVADRKLRFYIDYEQPYIFGSMSCPNASN